MVDGNMKTLRSRQAEINAVEAMPVDDNTKSVTKQAIERYYDKELDKNFDTFVNNIKQEN